ncbi:hypothetical protein K435DRAFT_794609 [Dendrothele bispora CBS 962.96]|uniref:DUF6534 domain-containing protein n=1 Tax=Dendrothele bispora (strain CBS 962.96) TaxID=1314807 RepID=A0A4S8MBC1_DENBC|nr:hypothetical protein K435DRAFT_794609 [Dendrothele bispora CBS 962.96]
MNQTAKYFSRYRRDSRLLKSWVAAVFFVDVACMAAMYAWVYFNTAKYFATTTIVSLVSSGITDVFLAITLVMLLKPMVKDSFREDTKQKVKQVLHRAISTGTLTAVLKIVMLTLAVSPSDSQSNVTLSLPFFLCRIQSISMLFNLNDRRRDCSDQSDNTTTSLDSSQEPEPEFHLTTINTRLGDLDPERETQHSQRI